MSKLCMTPRLMMNLETALSKALITSRGFRTGRRGDI